MDAQRRLRMIEALEEVFLKDGFRRVTVGELASYLHCSRRTLYELGPAKEDIFLLVLDNFLGRIRRRAGQATRSIAGPLERLEAHMAPGLEETRKASQFFAADVGGFPAARRMLEAHQRERIRVIRGLVAEGVARGVFRGLDPDLVAEVFASAYRRVSEPEFLAQTKLSMSEAYRELGQLLHHGLLHQDRKSAGIVARSASRPRRAARKQH